MPKLPVEIPEELLRHWHQEFRHNSPQSPNVALTVPLLHAGDLQQGIQQALEGSQEIPYSTSQGPCLPGNTDRPAAENDPEQGTEDRHKKRQKVQPAGPTEYHEYEDRTITVQAAAGTTTQLNIRLHIQNDNDSGKQYNYYNTDNYYRQSEWQGSGSGSGSWDGGWESGRWNHWPGWPRAQRDYERQAQATWPTDQTPATRAMDQQRATWPTDDHTWATDQPQATWPTDDTTGNDENDMRDS